MNEFRRVHAEIDLSAIRNNLNQMKARLLPDTMMYAVIKTDGYGHGAAEIAALASDLPYLKGFCVATVEEGVSLRQSGVTKPILILGYTFPDTYDVLVAAELSATVFTPEAAAALNEAAARAGKTLSVHLAVDTGMSRIGFPPDERGLAIAEQIAAFPHLKIEGIFTHFARADEKDKSATRLQFTAFQQMLSLLEAHGLKPEIAHCANSAAIMELPEMQLSHVRAGITMYGLWPSDEVDHSLLELQPAMKLKSHVAYVKELPPGRHISYGGTFTTDRPSRIATIPVGYGDGYPRSLSNKGWVLIHGKRAPITGRVCMDQFMVDVTEIPDTKVMDAVTLLGTDQDETISMELLGELSGRFNYELACDIGKRVPRVFFRDGVRVSERIF